MYFLFLLSIIYLVSFQYINAQSFIISKSTSSKDLVFYSNPGHFILSQSIQDTKSILNINNLKPRHYYININTLEGIIRKSLTIQ